MTIYTDRFSLVEDYLEHLDPIMDGIEDDFVKSRYLGFIAIAAVTVFELAIKDILYGFSDKKHKVLGTFARAQFNRINGRIKICDLKNNYIKVFGEKYVEKFSKLLNKKDEEFLSNNYDSPITSYNNIIVWRNNFIHGGSPPSTTNYDEIKKSYRLGKEVIHCLNESMRR